MAYLLNVARMILKALWDLFVGGDDDDNNNNNNGGDDDHGGYHGGGGGNDDDDDDDDLPGDLVDDDDDDDDDEEDEVRVRYREALRAYNRANYARRCTPSGRTSLASPREASGV